MKIKKLIQNAISKATSEKAQHVLVEHLTVELLQIKEIKELLTKHGVSNIDTVRNELVDYMSSKDKHSSTPSLSFNFEMVVKYAVTEAIRNGNDTVVCYDVLKCIMKDGSLKTNEVLKNHGLNSTTLIEHLNKTIPKKSKKITEKTQEKQALSLFTDNLVQQAKNGNLGECVGRSSEIDHIFHTFSRRNKNGVMILGKSGVGKTTIINGLCHTINSLDRTHPFSKMQIFSLDFMALVSSMDQPGMLEANINAIIDEVSKHKSSVLFIDDIHIIAYDFYPILKMLLISENIKIIACSTEEDYRQYFEKDVGLTRLFSKLIIEEPRDDEIALILNGTLPKLEQYYKVTINKNIIKEVIYLSRRYIHNGSMPHTAIDLLDSTAATVRLKNKKTKKTVTVDDVKQEITKFVKISSVLTNKNDKDMLRGIKEKLSSTIFGQTEAIECLVKSVYISKTGLRSEEKPLLNVLFQGPTSCGKTELTKELAKCLGVELMRFDLSAYQEKFSLSALIGSPPGYLGYSDGRAGDGLLVNAIEKNPNGILLLDEIEKAHPDILNLLLQIMDYGILTSASGKTVNCRNIMLIMTSNLGSDVLEKNRIGFGSIDNSDKFDEALKKFFKPEFRSRLDGIIKFNKLSYDIMIQIVQKNIQQIIQTMLLKDISISFSDDVVSYISKKAYESTLGARMVSTILDNEVKPLLAQKIVENDGNDDCVVNYDGTIRIVDNY